MRQITNSQTLYQKNKKLYKTFFSNYPLVVSAPGGVIMAGAFSHQFGGIGIHQKIPLRNYIGVKISNNNEGFGIQSYEIYDIFGQSFLEQSANNDFVQKIEFLKRKLNKTGYERSLKFGFLNELPRRCGLNNPGVSAANLAIIFLYLTGKLNHQLLLDFEHDKLDLDKSELIRRTIKEFHQAFIGHNNSGFGALSCFINSPLPIVYQANNGINIRPLDKIFPMTKQESPYDLIIIGTSDRNEIDFSLSKYDTTSNNLVTAEKYLNKIEQADFAVPGKIAKEKRFLVIDSYKHAIDASAISCLISLGKSWEKPIPENLNACLEAFNNSFNSLSLIGNHFKRKNKVANFIQNYFYKNLPDTPFALTTSIANNLILITIREHLRSCLNDLQKFLDQNLDFDITWPYISWIDGDEINGAKVEQSFQEDIHSNKLPKNSLIVKKIEKLDNFVETEAIDSSESIIGHFDLLLDADEKKIYIGIGKRRINSKDLPTVVRTIELFDLIFENDDLNIQNKNLPDVSYFIDRNESQSKIISPLKLLVKKELDVVLNLKITGQITNFSVSLLPSNLKIGLIKRT